CSSLLPMYSTSPSLNHLPTSPLRYILSPSLNGFSMNFSLLSSSRPQYPSAKHSPPMQISPIIFSATGLIFSSNRYIFVFAAGLPIGTLPLSSLSLSYRWIMHPTVASVGPYSLYISTSPPKLSLTSRASSVLNASPPTISFFIPLPLLSSSLISLRCDGVSFTTPALPSLITSFNGVSSPLSPYTITRLPLISGVYIDVTVRSNPIDEYIAKSSSSSPIYVSFAHLM